MFQGYRWKSGIAIFEYRMVTWKYADSPFMGSVLQGENAVVRKK